MPRLSDEQINNRVREAMRPAPTAIARQGSPQVMQSLIQKARQRRGKEIKPTPEQRVELRARELK